MTEQFKKLSDWYISQCNGKWEHNYGVSIDTLDNPGWSVEIDLAETKLAKKRFAEINQENGEEDWMLCKVEDNIFCGYGDPTKLETILQIFLDWAQIK